MGGLHQRVDTPRFHENSEGGRGQSDMDEDCRRC